MTESMTLPELARVLASGGVLQLMFKVGEGVATIRDHSYRTAGLDRSFHLYDGQRLLSILEKCGCFLVQTDGTGSPGGIIFFDDPKPMRHRAFWARKG